VFSHIVCAARVFAKTYDLIARVCVLFWNLKIEIIISNTRAVCVRWIHTSSTENVRSNTVFVKWIKSLIAEFRMFLRYDAFFLPREKIRHLGVDFWCKLLPKETMLERNRRTLLVCSLMLKTLSKMLVFIKMRNKKLFS